MLKKSVIKKAEQFFPNLKIRYKDESSLMKLIGKLMFFNKAFMTRFTTTIGSTIYFPSKEILKNKGNGAYITFLHELVHIYDAQNNKLFKLLYLFPQILSLLLLPLLFIFSWKIILPLVILCALPLPAYFRMKYEKRAYMVSMYAAYHLQKNNLIKLNKNELIKDILNNFKGGNYYYMWLFSSLDKEFYIAFKQISNGRKPYNDKVFNIIDSIMSKI